MRDCTIDTGTIRVKPTVFVNDMQVAEVSVFGGASVGWVPTLIDPIAARAIAAMLNALAAQAEASQ